MKFTVSKCRYLAAVSICQGRDAARYYLNGVRFAPLDRDGLRLVATDGHRLLDIADEAGHYSEDFSELIIALSAEALKAVRLKRNADAPAVFDVTSGVVTVSIGACQYPAALVDGQYPDFDRVIPTREMRDNTREAGGMPPALNTSYITDFGKIGAILGGDQQGIRIHHGTSTESALFLFPNADYARGVLMPMRV